MSLTKGNFLVDLRQAAIGGLMIRVPRISIRVIQRRLEGLVVPDPMYPNDPTHGINIGINPKTLKVWSIGTIQKDVVHIREEAALRRARTSDEVLTSELAKLDELESFAWGQRDGTLVLRCMQFRRSLLGYGEDDTLSDVLRREELDRELEKLKAQDPQDVIRQYRDRFTRPPRQLSR